MCVCAGGGGGGGSSKCFVNLCTSALFRTFRKRFTQHGVKTSIVSFIVV